MRLPWPFSRAQRSAEADGGATPEGPAGSPPERASGDAWRQVPPLAETVGPPPLVAPNRPFAAALASNEPPAPILKPLSHGRSLEAPRGIVSGIARPAASVAGLSLPAPVQRSPLARRSGSEDAAAWLDATPEPDPEPATAGHTETVATTPPGPAPEPPAAPIRRLEPMTASAVPSRVLTQAPEPARRTPLVGLVGQPRETGARGPASGVVGPGVQRSPATAGEAGTTPATSPKPAPQAPQPVTQAPLAGAPRLTIGQARRLGLGAPVAGGPVTSASPMFGGGPAGHPIGAAAPAPTSPMASATGVQRSPESGAPDLPLTARQDVGAAAPIPETPPADTGGPAMTVQAPAGPPSPVLARPIAPVVQRSPTLGAVPLTSAQPLRTGVQRAPVSVPLPQRSPANHGHDPATASASPSGGSSSVKVHRDGQAASLSAALDARSFTHGGEIYLPSSHGPLTSGPGRALLAHELTHVTQQQRLGSSLPPEHTSYGKSLEAEAVAAERTPELVLASGRDREADSAAPPLSAAPAAPSAPAGPAPGPQRAPAGQGQPALEMGPVTLLSGGDEGKAGATARQRKSGHTHTEQELEVLAHQLYHRIGRHLRRELLVDRERVGFALDLP
jgi:hypothetical protein